MFQVLCDVCVMSLITVLETAMSVQ